MRHWRQLHVSSCRRCQRGKDVQFQSSILLQQLLRLLGLLSAGRVVAGVEELLDWISFRYLVGNRLVISDLFYKETVILTISTPYHNVFSV